MDLHSDGITDIFFLNVNVCYGALEWLTATTQNGTGTNTNTWTYFLFKNKIKTMKKLLPLLAIILFSCQKENGIESKYDSYAQYQIDGVITRISGDEVYIRKVDASASIPGAYYYLQGISQGLSLVTMCMKTEDLTPGSFENYVSSVLVPGPVFWNQGRIFTSLVPRGRISISVTRVSNGNADGLFQGKLFSVNPAQPAKMDSIIVVNGQFKNVKIY